MTRHGGDALAGRSRAARSRARPRGGACLGVTLPRLEVSPHGRGPFRGPWGAAAAGTLGKANSAANESKASSMAFEVGGQVGGVPEVDRAVLACGGEPGAVGGKGNPPHPLGMPFQPRDAAARVEVP